MVQFGFTAVSDDDEEQTTPEIKPSRSTFNPPPFSLSQAKGKATARGGGRNRLLSLASSSASSSSSSSSSSDGDDHDDLDDMDSEEEEWPVAPVGSVGVTGWAPLLDRKRNKGKGRARDQNINKGITLDREEDVWETNERKERASSWSTANQSFHRSLSRALSSSPSSSSQLTSSSADLASIHSLFSALALSATRATAELHTSFQTRNTALWTSIEASITEAEQQGMQQLEESRKRKEAMALRAQQMRDDEAKRVQEEMEKKVSDGKRKEEDERIKREQEGKRREEGVKAAEKRAREKDAKEGSPQAEFERWTLKMLVIKTSILPVVSQNPSFRSACFAAKRAITPKIGQLTNSASAIASIITSLASLLTSLRPPSPLTPNSPGYEPYIWILNHLAKALIRQAETEVTAKLTTAYPLGRVVVGLILRGHEELGEVLMARLVKKCFWITGWWPLKREDQTPEQHQKTLGHAPPSAGESLVQYAQRQSGLLALYAAILQTSPSESPQSLPPSVSATTASASLIPIYLQPSYAWRWLVLILRPPFVSLEPTPLLLITFLEITGVRLQEIYGRQFNKYLDVLWREGISEGKAGFKGSTNTNAGTNGGGGGRASYVRLGMWLEEWEKKGVVQGCVGREVEA